jgi:hypothetical protein
MRRVLIAALAIILAIGGAGPVMAKKPSGSGSSTHSTSKAPKVHVRGYYRKDGTYVAPHDRAYPGQGTSSHTPKSITTSPRLDLAPAPGVLGGQSSPSPRFGSTTQPGIQRDSHGKIKRSESAKSAFKRLHPCPATGKSTGPCPGYIVDHVVPLCASGPDAAYNMQWQTAEQAKEKDRWEKKECNAFRHR